MAGHASSFEIGDCLSISNCREGRKPECLFSNRRDFTFLANVQISQTTAAKKF
jgi:hypothetical protein